MAKYQSRRHAEPLWQQIASSYWFQALLIIIIVVGTSFSIYRKKKKDIELQLSRLESLRPIVPSPSSNPHPSTRSTMTDPHRGTAIPPTPVAPPPTPTAPAHEAPAGPAAAAENVDGTAPTGISVSTTPTLHWMLAEVSISFLNRMGDTRSLSGQGNINAAVVPNLDTHLQAGHDSDEVLTLDDNEHSIVQIGRPIEYNRMNVDPVSGASLGLEVRVNPNSLDVRGLHFNMIMTRAVRDAQGAPAAGPRLSQLTFRDNVTLTNNSAVFVYGMWPHRAPVPGEDKLLADIFLNLMNRAEFLNSSTDLVLFIKGTSLPEGAPSGR
jgi:hypothetical protein